MNLKIKGKKPVNVGNSFYFLIPKAYFTNEVIEEDKKYDIIIKESK